MTVIRAEQVQSRGDEETFRNRPEALGNRRAGNTTGEWSAHKLPRRLGWPRWEGPEQGSRNCVGGAAERPLRRPQGRQRARQSPPASLPFARGKGKSLGFRKNRSLEPMTHAQNLPPLRSTGTNSRYAIEALLHETHRRAGCRGLRESGQVG